MSGRNPDAPFAVRVGWLMEWLGEHLPHRAMWLPGRRLICSAADTSYGWNPEAIDWDEKATRLDRWIDGARNRG